MANISVILSAYVGGPTYLRHCCPLRMLGMLGGSPLHLRLTGGHGTDSMADLQEGQQHLSAVPPRIATRWSSLSKGHDHGEARGHTDLPRWRVLCERGAAPGTDSHALRWRTHGEEGRSRWCPDSIARGQLCNDMSNNWPKKQCYSMLLHCPIGFTIFEFSLVIRVLRTKLVQWFHQLSIIDAGKTL